MEKLKTIRFNLRFFTGSESFESVHSVEELEEKLRTNQIAFDDLMAYFFSGQLQRWLECHGDKDASLLGKLREIDTKASNKLIVKALFAALDFSFDEQEIDRMIVSYDFPVCLQKNASDKARSSEEKVKSMQDEIDAYETICRQILERKGNWSAVRALVDKMLEKYYPIFELDVSRFYKTMKSPVTGCPSAMIRVLSSKKGRKLFKGLDSSVSVIGGETFPKYRPTLSGPCGQSWLKFYRTASSKFYIEVDGEGIEWQAPFDCVLDYSDDWKNLMPRGRKVMILCNNGVSVGDGEVKQWEAGEMNDRYLVLDGCSYKQEYKTRAFLAYAEL